MSDQNWMRVLCTVCVGEDTMKDGLVNVDSVLPSHEVVNNLQYRPVEGGRMVKS